MGLNLLSVWHLVRSQKYLHLNVFHFTSRAVLRILSIVARCKHFKIAQDFGVHPRALNGRVPGAIGRHFIDRERIIKLGSTLKGRRVLPQGLTSEKSGPMPSDDQHDHDAEQNNAHPK